MPLTPFYRLSELYSEMERLGLIAKKNLFLESKFVGKLTEYLIVSETLNGKKFFLCLENQGLIDQFDLCEDFLWTDFILLSYLRSNKEIFVHGAGSVYNGTATVEDNGYRLPMHSDIDSGNEHQLFFNPLTKIGHLYIDTHEYMDTSFGGLIEALGGLHQYIKDSGVVHTVGFNLVDVWSKRFIKNKSKVYKYTLSDLLATKQFENFILDLDKEAA